MKNNKIILYENSEWLRYVFWACAVGFCFLTINLINMPDVHIGKIVGSMMGILLFTFCGFVYQTHRIFIDPAQRKIIIISKGFRESTSEIIKFDDVDRIILVKTYEYDEDLAPANRWQDRWSLALACKRRTVPISHNFYINKEKAVGDAMRIKQVLNVDIADNIEDSIASLAQSGRKIEAVILATRSLGMTTEQATDYVDMHVGGV